MGSACNYVNDYVSLNGKKASLGLPTFSQNFFNLEIKDTKITYFDANKVVLNKALVLKNITFDFSKYTLKSSSFIELDKVVLLLKNNPSYKILILGHTDNIGNKSSNILLSQNRAKTVKEYLVSKGINETRINFEGKGSAEPVSTNSTDEGRAKNRRVEFILKN